MLVSHISRRQLLSSISTHLIFPYWLTKETLHLNSKSSYIDMYSWGNKRKYGTFLLLMACLWCTTKRSVWENLKVVIKTLKIDVVFFFLYFVKNSKRHTHDMEFRKRSKIVSNKDVQESRGLTQIGVACVLFPTYRWHVKFDVNVFNNI